MAVSSGKGLLRQVNNTIRELAGRTASGETWEFICECDDLACFTLVPLTLPEFDAHRGRTASGQPILADHHDDGR
jgi:hypothetical protein